MLLHTQASTIPKSKFQSRSAHLNLESLNLRRQNAQGENSDFHSSSSPVEWVLVVEKNGVVDEYFGKGERVQDAVPVLKHTCTTKIIMFGGMNPAVMGHLL